jgi:hypothetical protein
VVYKRGISGYNFYMASKRIYDDAFENRAGDAVRERGIARALIPLMTMVLATGFVLGGAVAPGFLSGNGGLVAFLVVFGGLYAAWTYALNILHRHEDGAIGEEVTARALSVLPESWHCVHNVSLGNTDIDHVGIGPPGICAIETIRWRGRVDVKDGKLWDGDQTYSGYELKTLRQKTEDFVEYLNGGEVPRYTCVVLTGGRLGFESSVKDGVWIGDVTELVPYLRSLPGNDAVDVDRLVEQMEKNDDNDA